MNWVQWILCMKQNDTDPDSDDKIIHGKLIPFQIDDIFGQILLPNTDTDPGGKALRIQRLEESQGSVSG